MPPTDQELVTAIKEQGDSNAIIELIHRHTGAYFAVVQRYAQTYPNVVKYSELADDKMFNIYKTVLDYDPTKGTKFSTYLSEKTDWLCKKLLRDDGRPTKLSVKNEDSLDEAREDGSPATTLTDETPSGHVEETADRDLSIESILEEAGEVKDKRFVEVLRYRHLQTAPLTWREIGVKMGVSHEWARLIYEDNMERVRKRLKERVA